MSWKRLSSVSKRRQSPQIIGRHDWHLRFFSAPAARALIWIKISPSLPCFRSARPPDPGPKFRRIPHDRARWRHTKRPVSCPGPEHLCLHRLFRRLDDLFDHRRADQGGSRAQRHAIRAARGHAGADRIDKPHFPRRLDRTVRRADHVSAADADHFGRRVAADQRADLRDIPAGRARAGACRRIVHRRDRLYLALVREGAAGHGPGHFRGRQRRRGCHEFRRAVPRGGDGLGRHRAGLCRGSGGHGRAVFRPRQDRSGP